MSHQEPPPPPSDSGSSGFGTVPPPPGYHQAPPQYGGQPQYDPSQYVVHPGMPGQQPPRPDVKIGALLVIVGSLITIIGVFLPWVTIAGENRNGMSAWRGNDFVFYDGSGIVAIAFAIITAGLGLALFFAGRVLAVAIIAIVVASLALLVGLGMIAIAADGADFGGGSIGFGAILQPIAPMLTLAGSIVATAKRRRWTS